LQLSILIDIDIVVRYISLVPLTSSFTCQLISIIITTLIIHHSFTLSLQAQNLPFQQILPTLDFFYLPDCLHDNGTGPDLSCSSFLANRLSI